MLSVIGCGNLNRSDDGVGVLVVQRLAERLRKHPVPGVQAFDCGTAGMEVMFRARGSDALLIVDASASGSAPGTVYEVPGEELAADYEATYSLHDFRWQHALGAGRKIYGEEFPAQVSVWLIEAAELGLGVELSAPVAAAAEQVYAKVLERVAAYAAARGGKGGLALEVRIRAGRILLPSELYKRTFGEREGAVVVAREGRLCLYPVEQVAGGLLVKQRNAAGDRVVDACEVLRGHGWDDLGELSCPARWDIGRGALVLEMPAVASAGDEL